MDTSLFTMLSHAIVALLAFFVSPTLARANNHTLNCSDVNVVIGASARHGSAESLFAQLASFSGLDELVVPGGLFYEVTGDLTFFVPKDDALEIEYWKEALGLSGNETVRENKAYVQEILRSVHRVKETSPSGIADCSSRSMGQSSIGRMPPSPACRR